jgi:hypothetical protein
MTKTRSGEMKVLADYETKHEVTYDPLMHDILRDLILEKVGKALGMTIFAAKGYTPEELLEKLQCRGEVYVEVSTPEEAARVATFGCKLASLMFLHAWILKNGPGDVESPKVEEKAEEISRYITDGVEDHIAELFLSKEAQMGRSVEQALATAIQHIGKELNTELFEALIEVPTVRKVLAEEIKAGLMEDLRVLFPMYLVVYMIPTGVSRAIEVANDLARITGHGCRLVEVAGGE